MDVLTGVYSPDAGGRHQEALSHLGGPAGFLVIFRLSFEEHPLVAEAIYSPQCVCTLQLTTSTLHQVHNENSPFSYSAHFVSPMWNAQGYVLPNVNSPCVL